MDHVTTKMELKEGVPMGGDIFTQPSGKSPNFVAGALKAPYGGILDTIQIVKEPIYYQFGITFKVKCYKIIKRSH